MVAKDVFAAISFLFAFGIITIIGFVITSAMVEEYKSSPFNSTAVITTGDAFLSAYAVFDWVTVIVMVLFIVGIGITSGRVASSPMFFFLTFVMSLFYGFVAYFFNFIFQEIVTQPTLVAVSVTYPRTLLICTNLHWVALIMLVVGSIAMFGKKEKGQFLA